ncbi:MAG: hypothetical protein R2746_17865 [Acidimicrobiales bacterium]
MPPPRSSSAARSPASGPTSSSCTPRATTSASDERPFLQIGESKYGKFMLELAVHAKVDLESAVKVALSSMLSTARANLSVGPPYDLGIYRNGSLELVEHRIGDDSPYLADLQHTWVRLLTEAIEQLPAIPPDAV